MKLLQDTEAVVAAMVLPYSQRQTEGRINKLKLVKRSMYGRGKFDLLSETGQRTLSAAGGFGIGSKKTEEKGKTGWDAV